MASQDPPTYDEVLTRIRELAEEIESLDSLLLLRDRAANDGGQRHGLADVAMELGADNLL